MKDLRIGVIGASGRGRLAAYAHQPDAGSRIMAACDLSEEALQTARELYGADIFTTDDYRALLEQDLDGVFIATPDWLHEEMALAALQAGKAVYLEKPMAITTAGCDRLLQAAYETKSRLYLGHNMRHMPFVIKMKRLIEEGAVGEVKAVWCRHFVGHGGDYYFRDWHAERRYSTSLLLQKAAHDIDVIHWLAGSYSSLINGMGGLTFYDKLTDRLPEQEEPHVRSREGDNFFPWPPDTLKGLNPVIDVEDLSMMQMRMQNGIFASYQQCHYTPDYWRNYTVIGTEGRLENFGNGGDGTVIRLWNQRHHEWDEQGDVLYRVEKPTGGHGGSDPRIVNEFLRFVREGGPTQTSPVAARYSVAAGCAAADSLRDGGTPRTIPPVPEELNNYFTNNQTA